MKIKLMTHYRKKYPPFLVPETEITNLLVQAKIEDYKFIRGGVKFAHKIHKIHKNATGKILRTELPKLFETL